MHDVKPIPELVDFFAITTSTRRIKLSLELAVRVCILHDERVICRANVFNYSDLYNYRHIFDRRQRCTADHHPIRTIQL